MRMPDACVYFGICRPLYLSFVSSFVSVYEGHKLGMKNQMYSKIIHFEQ